MLVAVDTGGTKTLVATFSGNGKIKNSSKFPTPKDPTEYISTLSETIDSIVDGRRPQKIVIAMPGTVKHGVAVSCANLGWKNVDVQYLVEKRFPGTEVLVENDANLGGLGETHQLEKIPETVLYLTISTGIGAGVVSGGKLDRAMSHIEAGHAMVDFEGKMLQWESFASGRAIHHAYGKYGSDIEDPKTWKEIAHRISRGFLMLIPVIQPDVVIIGGSMGTHFSKYKDFLHAILKKEMPEVIPIPTFITAKHPEEAVIYGCYYYGLDQNSR